MPDTLKQDEILTVHQDLVSWNGKWRLVYQSDGNLVGYPTAGGPAFWATNVQRSPGKTLMQTDGNLVCYDVNRSAYWASNTVGKGQPPFYKLVMQNDRNIVIYDSGNNAIWASNTQQN